MIDGSPVQVDAGAGIHISAPALLPSVERFPRRFLPLPMPFLFVIVHLSIGHLYHLSFSRSGGERADGAG